jgi:glycosyltransferase involved in cell wall biosynthesis
MMMNCCDQILSVSQFTSDRIHSQHQVPSPVLKVLNNCLDPFLPVGFSREPEQALRDKYGFTKDDTILFTLTRLSSKERYKGYDKVLQALVELKKTHHRIRYLLAGSYDAEEKRHLDDMIDNMGLAEYVRIPGFISDDELVSHFSIADIYVMPSMKEGFGIVFIEAMYYGLPVIAGNKDGSVDALLNGELGILVDPMDPEAIRKAIQAIMEQGDKYLPDRKKLMDHFSYDQYKNKFENLIGAENLQQ